MKIALTLLTRSPFTINSVAIGRAWLSTIDALAMAAERAPDVVLSDVGLPEMDGYALARRLQAIASLRDTIFVATTGYAGESDHSDALATVFDAHFTKPVDLEQLDRFLRLASATTQRV